MLTFACRKQELSCIIGNLFTEIEPPCDLCGVANEIMICGNTYTGTRAVLIVTEHGFKYSGKAIDIERIREKGCAIEPKTATEKSI